MSLFEIIERLCAVTHLQADIIKEQAEVIAQAEISDKIAAELSEKRETAVAALAVIDEEYG